MNHAIPPSDDSELFSRYPRAVAHMHHQHTQKRFGLILGAGVSTSLGYPNWRDLIKRLAEDPRVDGTDLIKTVDDKPPPIQAQILFGRFKDKNRRNANVKSLSESDAERILRAEWRNLVHQCLYERQTTKPDSESAYGDFLEVIRHSPMTVNYNFDDTVERLLLQNRSVDEKHVARGYETVVDARLQFRRDDAIIYHPNGYLPRNLLDGPSDRVVLTEDSFGDQLIESLNGQFAALVNHLSKNTCLFIGLSLDDQTLRHILRQHARMNPGHVHYYARFVRNPAGLSDDTRLAEVEANFDVFNLITLFLTESDLRAMGRLLAAEDEELANLRETPPYCFYLSGVPGTGKTTTASYLRNLITYDEWLEERPKDLAKPHKDLTEIERQKVDDWVLSQIRIKNNQLVFDSRTDQVGIRVVDRCLTDPVAFTPEDQWPAKAAAVKSAIALQKPNQEANPGHVILLIGEPQELVVRVKGQNKDSDLEYTTNLQAAMQALYPLSSPGITHLDVRGNSVHEVVKKVTRLIHLEDYGECNLHQLLGQVEKGTIAPPARAQP